MVPDWLLPKTQRPALEHPDPDHEQWWKDEILLRDEASCVLCFRHTDFVGQLDVHHVTYERFGKERAEDGVLLCRRCHESVTIEQRRKRLLEDKARERSGSTPTHSGTGDT